MKAKSFVVAGFAIHALLGSACLAPTAFAGETPAAKVERMEMAMTPMFPMTPAHCEHCLRSATWEPQSMGGACAGRCLAAATDDAKVVMARGRPLLAAAAPVILAVSARTEWNGGLIDSTAPPDGFSPTRTIVLLQ